MTRAFALLGLLACSGCQPLIAPVAESREPDAIVAIEGRITELVASVAGVERALASSSTENEALVAEITEHSKALGRVETTLAELPERLKNACPAPPPRAAAECPSDIQRIPVSADKLVLGLRERVLVDPPGAVLVARIDTSLTSNSLYVSDIVEFQRDGNNWVRFNVAVAGEEAPREVERVLRRRGRGDGDATPPLAVRLRVSLGDVTESYDFTLVDRKARDHQVRLGRSFLRDVALVDVSREFLQPRPTPQKPAT
jgi:hypothetical protein